MAAKNGKNRAEKSPEKSADKATENSAESKLSATRQRDLDAAISTIQKTYGEGSIMRLGDAHAKVGIGFHSHGRALGGSGAGHRRGCRAGGWSRFSGRNRRAKTTLIAARHRQRAKASVWFGGVH